MDVSSQVFFYATCFCLQKQKCPCGKKSRDPGRKSSIDFVGTRPRLKIFRQKFLSGHQLTPKQACSGPAPLFDSYPHLPPGRCSGGQNKKLAYTSFYILSSLMNDIRTCFMAGYTSLNVNNINNVNRS